MEIAVREARSDEIELVAALNREAIAELRPHRGGEIWSQWEARPEPLEGSLAALAADTSASLLVGTIDGVVVGYAAIAAHALHDGRRIGHLTDLYVLPDARGVGVGETVMQRLTEWCGEQGCVGIDSIALPGDRETKNFFETFGLVARALRVHRAL
jgi:ribosomal protein S18 acetylase RimI-like enzyme